MRLKFLAFLFFLIFFFLYLYFSPGPTPYDYFTRLAASFLQGKYYIPENPSWLSELIPAKNGGFYIAYPPMPAILAMPFLVIFGHSFPQPYLAHFLGAGVVFLTIHLSYKIKRDWWLAIWSGFMVGGGSIIFYLSSVGSSWYLGQISAAFFLTGALVEIVGKKRPLLLGILVGGAFLSRIHLILTIPFFLLLLGQKKNKSDNWKQKTIPFFLGLLPFLTFNFIYNFLRFGTILDRGYFLIPGLFNESWYQEGLFSLSYIPRHLKVLFTSLPIIQSNFPYLKPSWAGLAIWLTSPTFIYSLFAPIKEKLVKFSWLAIGLICLVIFSHGTTGFAQFGYRFAVDFYPFLFLLTIKAVAKRNLKWHHWLLLLLSLVVNFWGVVWINKFGWVSY